MRRTITAAAVAAIAVAGLAGTATAQTKPSIRQIWIYEVGTADGSHINGERVKIRRTDQKSPAGVRVCLQKRAHLKASPRTIACAAVDANGYHYFRFRDNLSGGEQWRVHHAETATLANYYGPWVSGAA